MKADLVAHRVLQLQEGNETITMPEQWMIDMEGSVPQTRKPYLIKKPWN